MYKEGENPNSKQRDAQLNRIFKAASILLSVDCKALITAALSNPIF